MIYVSITYLYKLQVKQLKQLCKYRNLTGYSNMDKHNLITILSKDIAAKKIQHQLRKRWIKDNLCPISMEHISYPCYAFKPKGFDFNQSGPLMIYYNLVPLLDYLLVSGDFRDPKTREPYSEEFIKSLDEYVIRQKIKTKSVLKASKNKNFYKKRKDREEELIILERCLDEVVSSMRMILEVVQENSPVITLNSFHFPTYHRYFRSLLYKSEDNARHTLNSTINIITGPPNNPTQDPNNVKDLIFQFIYTLEATYF